MSGASFVIRQSVVCNFFRRDLSRQRGHPHQGGSGTAWESESRRGLFRELEAQPSPSFLPSSLLPSLLSKFAACPQERKLGDSFDLGTTERALHQVVTRAKGRMENLPRKGTDIY